MRESNWARFSALLILAIAATRSPAQPPPSKPGLTDLRSSNPGVKISFEVVSVKLHKDADGKRRWLDTPSGLSVANIPLRSLIAVAYGVKPNLLYGWPSWVGSLGFDIEAKVAAPDTDLLRNLSTDERNSLLQAVLEDRFHLRLHAEKKVLPIFALRLAKGGAKLQPSRAPAGASSLESGDASTQLPTIRMRPNELVAERVTMTALVSALGTIVQRPVINDTGLDGRYDLTLRWNPDEEAPADGSFSGAPSPDAPSIFTALSEQLGLRLVSAEGPVDALVIDDVRMPSPN